MRRGALRTGVRVRVASSISATVTAELLVTARQVRPRTVRAAAADAVVAQARRGDVSAAQVLALRVPAGLVRGTVRRLRVRVTATTRDGRTAVVTRALRVR